MGADIQRLRACATMVVWLIKRGALAEEVKCVHKTYYLPSMCPIASLIFEEVADAPETESNEECGYAMSLIDCVCIDNGKDTYSF